MLSSLQHCLKLFCALDSSCQISSFPFNVSVIFYILYSTYVYTLSRSTYIKFLFWSFYFLYAHLYLETLNYCIYMYDSISKHLIFICEFFTYEHLIYINVYFYKNCLAIFTCNTKSYLVLNPVK